jgi:hypothetical protein
MRTSPQSDRICNTQRDSWQRATDLLLKAASGAASVEDATTQIERALFMELTLLLSGQNVRSVWE